MFWAHDFFFFGGEGVEEISTDGVHLLALDIF